MSLLRTLLWREGRDHRTMLLVSAVLGPVMLALVQQPYSLRLTEDLTAEVLIPVMVFVFASVLGGDLFSREAESGVRTSFARLPLPASWTYIAKLLVFSSAVICMDVWFVACEALRLWSLAGGVELFLDASLGALPMHAAALLLGLGAFSVATWIQRSLPSMLASILLFALLPFLAIALLPVSGKLLLAGLVGTWGLGAWAVVVMVALGVAGFFAWRVRDGAAHVGVRRPAAFLLGGLLVMCMASGAAAAQWWWSGSKPMYEVPTVSGSSLSLDGRLLAVRTQFGLPYGGLDLRLWGSEVQAQVERNQRRREREASRFWILDLQTGEQLGMLQGYTEAQWDADGQLLVRRWRDDRSARETDTWDLDSGRLLGATLVEPAESMKPPAQRFHWSHPDPGSPGFWLRTARGFSPAIDFEDARSVPRLIGQATGIVFVSGAGELTTIDLSGGLPGVTRVVAADMGAGEFLVWVSAGGRFAMVLSRERETVRLFDLELGIELPHPGPEFRFIGWTRPISGSVEAVARFAEIEPRGQPDDPPRVFVMGPHGLIRLDVAVSASIVRVPDGGYLAFEYDIPRAICDLVLLDDSGKRKSLLERFTF